MGPSSPFVRERVSPVLHLETLFLTPPFSPSGLRTQAQGWLHKVVELYRDVQEVSTGHILDPYWLVIFPPILAFFELVCQSQTHSLAFQTHVLYSYSHRLTCFEPDFHSPIGNLLFKC